MAKKPAKKSGERGAMSQSVRDYISKNPDAKPKQIFDGLGGNIKIGLINAILAKSRKNGRSQKSTKRSVGPKRGRNGNGHGDLQSILKAAAFVRESGGIASARAALDALETIKSSLA